MNGPHGGWAAGYVENSVSFIILRGLSKDRLKVSDTNVQIFMLRIALASQSLSGFKDSCFCNKLENE